jgi:hypothetical protein
MTFHQSDIQKPDQSRHQHRDEDDKKDGKSAQLFLMAGEFLFPAHGLSYCRSAWSPSGKSAQPVRE